jgi:hypothetical protein
MRGRFASVLYILGALLVAFGAWRIYAAISTHGEQWKLGAFFVLVDFGVFGGMASMKGNAARAESQKKNGRN